VRLITCIHNDKTILGSWIDGDARTVDLMCAARLGGEEDLNPFTSMLALIEAGEAAWSKARHLTTNAPAAAIVDSRDCRLLAPLPRPVQVRDFLCFEGHLIGAMKSMATLAARQAANPEQALRQIEERDDWTIPAVWYKQPVYYSANRMAIAGPDDIIRRPGYSKLFDYELEFAAVIGKPGRDIRKEDAREYIFGYTIYNDWSARDEQMRVMPGMLGPGKGKDFDQGITLGPCIVTTDEMRDPYDLAMIARVNGEQWSSGNSGEMYHKFEDCIADVSRSLMIFPGEVFGSGTVTTGCGLELLRFLENGDVVELEVADIGTLRNEVAP
jgi:2-keto-4-pentenoate hydratase/2-oxohepta-3-ene-1,7-dioic acid hydratase in catechol pathway